MPSAAAFRKLTKSHLNQTLAIVVEGTNVASPLVREEIGADVTIAGKFSRDAADQLARAIRSGHL